MNTANLGKKIEHLASAHAESILLAREAFAELKAENERLKALGPHNELLRSALKWVLDNQLVYEQANQTWTHRGKHHYELSDNHGIPRKFNSIFYGIERELDKALHDELEITWESVSA